MITQKELSPMQYRVWKMLEEAGEQGVMNYDFARHYVLSYRKRISELRRLGFNIERRHAKGMRGVNIYRLVQE